MIRFEDIPAPPAPAKPRPAARIIAGLKDAIAFAAGDETRGRIVKPDPARASAARKAVIASKPRKPAKKPKRKASLTP